MDDLKSLAVLARVVENGSFRKAAAELGVAPQATSKTVRQLEAQLGVRLLHRTTRKLSLTEEGAQLLRQIAPAIANIRSAVEELRNAKKEVGGTLRITAPRSMGRHFVLPLVPEFMRLYPELRIEFELEDRLTDSVLERVDLGFRMGGGVDRNVVARRLMDIQQWVCASPGYIEHHGRPRNWADLASHRCTGFRHSTSGRVMPWEFVDQGEVTYTELAPRFVTNDVDAELDAVLGGAGIGQIPAYIARPLIEAGQLVHLLKSHSTERIGFYLYYPQRTQMPQRTRRFIDFVIERLGTAERR
ncbi:MAG: LysR family transcriptional regulator [Moraxellaceae bacterium]|nr:LysR family transcriptional regulator [Moraxellaceae bacterium]